MKKLINLFETFFKVLLSKKPSFSNNYDNNQPYLLLEGIKVTLFITFLSCFISFFIGLLGGIFLYLSKIHKKKKTYFIINFFVNIIISTPYLLLFIFILDFILRPFFNLNYGFNVGLILLSLIVSALFSKHCEQVFLQTNPELYSTAFTLGANNKQFITLFLLPEAKPYIILKLNYLFISSLAYSNVLGFIGIDGIGSIAYKYGYEGHEEFKPQGFSDFDLIWSCILIVFILVQLFNLIIDFIYNKLDKNK
ncbi:MAG: ABC transporter permease subunit [Candidatus Phytoplasma stylosanthis]|nr:ABC transporter permease subunit [Candidatus Phytoplasma stylosanthis]